jgi:6-pyruvoyltetrahydropterin/6-carboxytetrahydropterin synthase
MAKYLSTKTYGNDRGLSCVFRQWRSTHSHCSLLHGYSIGIKLIFESESLDDKNWVMDFGGLKAFKEWSEYMFDHTMVVAHDDPHLPFFQQMSWMGNSPVSGVGTQPDLRPHERGAICDLRIVDGVGCEKFAELVYKTMQDILETYQRGETYTLPNGKSFNARYPVGAGVRLRSAEVFEHSSNSAVYEG